MEAPFESKKKKTILHLILNPCTTAMSYNEFPLVQFKKHNISICSYFQREENLIVPTEITLFEGTGSLINNFLLIIRILKTNRYDVIHIHNVHQGILFLIYLLIHKKPTSTIVFTFHNSFANYKFRNKLFLIINYIFQDNFVFCSKASENQFPTWLRILRSKGKTTCSIPNGINIERINQVIQHNRISRNDSSQTTILSVGRLIPIKNPKLILSILKRVKSSYWQMTFLGDGFLKESLADRVKKENLSNQVKFLGVVPREIVYKIAEQSDIYISTSLGEGLPIAVMEALACGCYGILSDIEPHREIAIHCKYIKLCNPEKPEEYIDAINAYTAFTKQEKFRIRQKLSEYIQNNFSVKRMQSAYETIYFREN